MDNTRPRSEGEEVSEERGEREQEILHLFKKDGETEASLAFQGLKRRSRLHPEILSRTLDRLEEEGMIWKSEDGYRLTSKGSSLLKETRRPKLGEVLPIFQAHLFNPLDVWRLLETLKGRWFKSLRWLGTYSAENQTTLSWVNGDGTIQIDVKIEGSLLKVEAEVAAEGRVGEAYEVAYELVSQIARAYTHGANSIHAFYLAPLQPN